MHVVNRRVARADLPRKALDAPRENVADGVSSQEPAGNPDGLPESAGEQPAPSFSPAQLVQAGLIGAAAGLASGYVGLGGGFIMVPLMLSITKLPMKLTSGTSLIAVLILATPATITQCVLGNVDYVVGIATACGTIPGAVLGARLVRMIPERTLRFIFAIFLVVAAILLVVKELGLLG